MPAALQRLLRLSPACSLCICGPDMLFDQEALSLAKWRHQADLVICCLQPAGSLVAKCKTLDQARAVVTFLDAASEKTLRSTVALTAARGRGKVRLMNGSIVGTTWGFDHACLLYIWLPEAVAR